MRMLPLLPWKVAHRTGHQVIAHKQVQNVRLPLLLLVLLVLVLVLLLLVLPWWLLRLLASLAAAYLGFLMHRCLLLTVLLPLLKPLLLTACCCCLAGRRRHRPCRCRLLPLSQCPCRRRCLASQQLQPPLPHRPQQLPP